jgi:hypothetical protein
MDEGYLLATLVFRIPQIYSSGFKSGVDEGQSWMM